jgi:ABC-type oligopeptide transport system ATPase subunit
MDQLVKVFTISAKNNIDIDIPIQQQLVNTIVKFSKEKNYEILSISHHCYWYSQYPSWGGHAIVVFRPIKKNTVIQKEEILLNFE